MTISSRKSKPSENSMKRLATVSIAALAMLSWSAPAFAYIGPGAGLGMIGTALVMLAAIVMAVGFLIFWPVRKLLKRKSSDPVTESAGATDQDSVTTDKT